MIAAFGKKKVCRFLRQDCAISRESRKRHLTETSKFQRPAATFHGAGASQNRKPRSRALPEESHVYLSNFERKRLVQSGPVRFRLLQSRSFNPRPDPCLE
jgi:hypothetical protein